MQEKNLQPRTEAEFEDAMQRWFTYIAKDHHKDKDCHFYVFKKCDTYHYGVKDKKGLQHFRIVHHGYLMGEIDECFEELENLYGFVIDKIEKFIREDEEGDWCGAYKD